MIEPASLSAVLGAGASLGAAGPAGPSAARGGALDGGMFDSSGWNVNFGSGRIDSNRTQTPLPGVDSALSSFGQYLPYLAVAVIGLVIWKTTRKK